MGDLDPLHGPLYHHEDEASKGRRSDESEKRESHCDLEVSNLLARHLVVPPGRLIEIAELSRNRKGNVSGQRN